MDTRTLASCQASGRLGGLASTRLRLKARRLRKLSPALAPTVRATTQDIAFAAGFYEGDGSCGSQQGSSMRVTASQKDPEILNWLRNRFGGNVYLPKRADSRMLFQWQISGARARGFAQSIYGLLSRRRQQQILKVLGDF